MNDIPAATLDCGRTVEQISDYLASDRIPRDPDIETCPECLNALEALNRVSDLSRALLARDTAALPPPPEGWLKTIMANVQDEVRAGRGLPIDHPDPRAHVTISEGAVRALVRAAGDSIDGLIVGKCDILGEAERLGAAVEVNVTASVAWGEPISEIATTLRKTVAKLLRQHTELNVAAVNVTIEGLHGYNMSRSDNDSA